MKYDYTKGFLLESEFSPAQTFSSGIRPKNERGKWAGPVFVRIKAESCDQEKLIEVMEILCDLLNRGLLPENQFETQKTIRMTEIRNLLVLWQLCRYEEGKLKCLK